MAITFTDLKDSDKNSINSLGRDQSMVEPVQNPGIEQVGGGLEGFNPMVGEIMRPAIESDLERRKETQDWRNRNRATTDNVLLDYDAWKPEERSEVKDLRIIKAVMKYEHDLEPKTIMSYEMTRSQVSKKMFGEVITDDKTFVKKLIERAEIKRDSDSFKKDFQKSAQFNILTGKGYDDVMGELGEHAGKTHIPDDVSQDHYTKMRSRLEEKLTGKGIEMMSNVFEGFESKDRAGFMEDTRSLFKILDKEQRDNAARMIGYMAQEMGSNKEKKEFLEYLSESLRGVASTGRALGNSLDRASSTMMDRRQKVLEDEFERREKAGESTDDLDSYMERQSERTDEATGRKDENNFLELVINSYENEFDPTEFYGEENTVWGSVERGLHASPGAISTTVVAMVPYVGWAATGGVMYEHSKNSLNLSLYQQGMNVEDADKLTGGYAALTAIPNMLLEKAGAKALTGGKGNPFGWVEKKLLAKVGNNYATRFLTRNASEVGTELAQGIWEEAVKDIAHSMDERFPDVKWTGTGGVFDGYAYKVLETASAVAPMSGISAGIVKTDQIADAVMQMDDLAIEAAGGDITLAEDLRKAQGTFGEVAAAQAFRDSIDPNSEKAKTATEKLKAQLNDQNDAITSATEMGLLPSITLNEDGKVEIYDEYEGNLIGTAENHAGARPIVQEYLNTQEVQGDFFTDYVMSMLGTADSQRLEKQAQGYSERYNLRLGETFDVDTAIKTMPEHAERIREEVDLYEKAHGGNGKMSLSVNGFSQTEYENNQRVVTNQLFKGANPLTVIHESTHGAFRRALDSKALTKDEAVRFFRMADEVIGDKGQKFLKSAEDGDVTFTELDEAVSEWMESEILRTRKGKSSTFKSVFKESLASSAQGKDDANIINKFKAFAKALKESFKVALTRAAYMKKAIKEGKIEEKDIDDFRAKLQGTSQQEEFQKEVEAEYREITQDEVDNVENFTPSEDVPFSVGREGVSFSITPAQDAEILETLPRETYIMDIGKGMIGYRSVNIEDHTIYKGEKDSPKIKSMVLNGGDNSAISNSKYPIIKVTLSNGSHFLQQIRISDHDQVSSKAPKVYAYDYRGKNWTAIKDSAKEDLQELSNEIWDEQKNIIEVDPLVREEKRMADDKVQRIEAVERQIQENTQLIKTLENVSNPSRKKKLLKAVERGDSIAIKGHEKAIENNDKRITEAKKKLAQLANANEDASLTSRASTGAAESRQSLGGQSNQNSDNESTSFSITPAQDAEYLQAVEAGDVETQQKMVDEAARNAGYDSPKVYHGTAAKFDIFDKNRGGSATRAQSAEMAFFFTNDERTAQAYASYSAMDLPVDELVRKAEEAADKGDWDAYDKFTEESEAMADYEASFKRKEENARVVSAYLKGDLSEFDAKGEIPQALSVDGDLDTGISGELRKAQREGKEGVVFRNLDDAIGLSNAVADHYAVFKPNQIKSADPVTYDSDGNVIPLSKRFDEGRDEISFSIAGATAQGFDKAKAEGRTFIGKDGKERFEMDASKAKIKMVKSNKVEDDGYRESLPLGEALKEGILLELQDVLEFDELFAAYPELRDRPVYGLDEKESNGGTRGKYSISRDDISINVELDNITALSVILHEVQHAIQEREGFDPGSSPDQYAGEIGNIVSNLGMPSQRMNELKADAMTQAKEILKNGGDDATRMLKERAERGLDPDTPFGLSDEEYIQSELLENNEAYQKAVKDNLRENEYHRKGAHSYAYDRYRQAGGEVEARGVQKRMNMTAQERLDSPFMDDYGSYSIGNSNIADTLIKDALSRKKSPEARIRFMQEVARRLEQTKRDVEKYSVVAGKLATQKAISEERTKKSLKKESAMRQALKMEELEEQIREKYGYVLENDEVTKLRSQPVHAHLSHPTNHLKGELMSQAEALESGKFTLDNGDYDGAGMVSKTLFGGSLMPDQAAAELFEQVLIKSDDVDVMWDALAAEMEQVSNRKGELADAKNELKEARAQAKAEAQEWYETEVKKQARDHNKPAKIRRSLATLDAILMALPAELRGKVGGYTTLANQNSDKKRLEYLTDKLAKADTVIEGWQKKEITKQIDKLFKRGSVKKNAKGVPVSNLTAEFTDKVMKVAGLSKLTKDEVETRLEKVAEEMDKTKDQSLIDSLSIELAELMAFGNLDGKNAKELSEFYENLGSIVATGKTIKEFKDAEFKESMDELKQVTNYDVTGGGGTMLSSESKLRAKRNKWFEGFNRFHRANMSFEWLINGLARENKQAGTLESETHNRLARMVHVATHAEKRSNARMEKKFNDLMSGVFGLKGLKLTKQISKMMDEHQTSVMRVDYGGKGAFSSKTTKASVIESIINGKADYEKLGFTADEYANAKEVYNEFKKKTGAVKPERNISYQSPNVGRSDALVLSQDQAINLTMMFKQEGIKESMMHEGYTEDTMKEMETFLTVQSKQIRDWLAIEYKDNHSVVNAVFKEQNGVSLPMIENYSPIRRLTDGVGKEMDIDSHGGQAMSTNPNFTISRTKNFAEVDQTVGALSLYMHHMVQTNHYVEWAKPVKILRSLFSDKSVKKNINDYAGKSLLSAITEKIEWMADGGNRKANHLEFLDKMRSAHVYTALSYNWQVGIKQLTSLPAYAFDMGYKDFAKYSSFFMKNPVENWKEMVSLDYVRTRFTEGYERDVIDGLNQEGGAIIKGLQTGMIFGKAGDIVPVIVGGWMAKQRSYDLARASGMSKAEAEAKSIIDFEMATDRAQQAGDLKDQSSFSGGGSIFKLFTMYKTSLRQYYANVYESALDAKAGKKGAKSVFARRFLIGQIILPLTFQFASDLIKSPFNDDDDEDFDGGDYFRAMLLGPLNGLFIAGDAAELVASGISGTHIWEEKLPILDGMTKIARGITDLKAGDWGEGIDDVLRGAGKTFPNLFTYYDMLKREEKKFGLTED